MPRLTVVFLHASLALVACGGDDAASPDAAAAADAAVDAADRLETARAAARAAADAPACAAIAPFYWEIGDRDGALVAGANGTTYTADTEMNIASATKWVFGAYVVERFAAEPDRIDHAAMTMQSGYVSLGHARCALAATVAACFELAGNDELTPDAVGHFYYGGGHYQKYAIDLGLGADDNAALAGHVAAVIGDFGIGFSSPQPAGGARATPSGYARFLRAILRGDLAMRAHLGGAPVCTLPGAACPSALSSPIGVAWHYSYGHWVEDDEASDGAFSSAGYFGFYPWIDAGVRHYGIVARHDTGAENGEASAACGRGIRAAFLGALD